VLLRQGHNPTGYDALQHLPKRVKKGNGSPGSRGRVVPFAWLPQSNGVTVTKCNRLIGKINTGLKEGLKIGNKRRTKALMDEEGDAITACCPEWVQLFDNTGDLLLRN
jgi:iron only hydrogenase large subunit-like protein